MGSRLHLGSKAKVSKIGFTMIVTTFDDRHESFFHRFLQRDNLGKRIRDDIVDGLLGSKVGTLLVAATKETLGRDRVGSKNLGKIVVSRKDETDLNRRVVVVFGIKIVSDIHGLGGFGTSRRTARGLARGIRVIGGHNLSEPTSTCSRGLSNAIDRFAVGDNGGISNSTQQRLTKR